MSSPPCWEGSKPFAKTQTNRIFFQFSFPFLNLAALRIAKQASNPRTNSMTLNNAIEHLREEESAILREANEALRIVNESQPKLARVQQALAALGQKPTAKLNLGTGRRVQRKNGKPAATKGEVVALLVEILQDRGAFEKELLKAVSYTHLTLPTICSV